jgi:ketosteroid isomerase-like protein
MRRMLSTAAIICLLVPALSRAQASSATEQSVQKQLEPLMAQMLAAANAHDTDRFMALYLRQPSFVFTFNGMIINGWEAARTQQLKWWNNGKSDVVYKYSSPPEVTVLGSDAAVVTQPISASRTLPDGKRSTSEIVATTVWQKFPEGWRGVQVHESMATPQQH